MGIQDAIPSNGMSDKDLPNLPPFSWAMRRYPLPTPPQIPQLKDNETVYRNQNYVRTLAIAYQARRRYLAGYFYCFLAGISVVTMALVSLGMKAWWG